MPAEDRESRRARASAERAGVLCRASGGPPASLSGRKGSSVATSSADSALKELVVTDTIPLRVDRQRDKFTVLSTAEILADTIRNVYMNESVSALFQGENQLF